MDTAQFAIVGTVVVGVAAAWAPAVTARANRKHDHEMARSTRLYGQRQGTYLDVGRFLERQRLMLEHEARQADDEPAPVGPSEEEWAELHARLAITGSDDAYAKLTAYYKARAAIVDLHLELSHPTVPPPDEEQEAQALQDARAAAIAAIVEAEHAMRDELAEI